MTMDFWGHLKAAIDTAPNDAVRVLLRDVYEQTHPDNEAPPVAPLIDDKALPGIHQP